MSDTAATTTTTEPAARSSRLDPDALAALEEERAFLLRSLEDLEREHDAGDIDDDDYQQLADGYVARTAEVLRAIEEQREAFQQARRPTSPARMLTIVSVLLVIGVVAGLLLAQSAGRRRPGETVTGADALPKTATQEARECVDLTSQNQVGEAVECYRAVLDRDPENPTALTYLGWTLFLSSSSLDEATGAQALTAAKGFLDRAVAADPAFADPYAFLAIIADREGRVEDAKAALDKLDTLDPPPDIRTLTTALRTRVETAIREQGSAGITTVPVTTEAP